MADIFTKKEERSRKEKSEEILKQQDIKINFNLPHIETDEETILRTPEEIARRVTVLAVTNLIAFDSIEPKEAIDYLKDCGLWEDVTPDEKDFLNDPTEHKKSQESWKCECIWVLLWALKKVDTLPFPDELCDLNDIAAENYPIGGDIGPNDFIHVPHELRSKSEILDAADLYYRYDWACVDARINNLEMETIDSGVVYERHYALNWLITYMDQDWDDVSCDT
ncbi:hypothetical protein B0A69_15600 [Chryseobacterium shigense]|uniref:DUF4272 domain-containing protein n=1 Tax=Chryseobacterium shigense TaxID=297244 RepID=A0A1N7IT18_9FLAO|nr:DUF4272 domain-containing protein [Chryseobacterium shigense]PQA92454.1 hypothetical protein B0A69_15600 [Chryseobacterium shigense]SIS40224.1 protein of unknown function [Chryseobacterium shigense]